GFNCFIWRSLHRTVTYRVLDLRACLAVLLSTAAGATRSPSDVRGASDNEKAGVPCSWGRAIPQVLGPVVGADPYCSGAEEGQHAAVVGGGVVQAELGEHPADVGLDGLGAQHKCLGDGVVGPALGDQGQYLTFAAGELIQGPAVAGPLDQPGHDGGVQHAFAV